jgi:hypothetical protein
VIRRAEARLVVGRPVAPSRIRNESESWLAADDALVKSAHDPFVRSMASVPSGI